TNGDAALRVVNTALTVVTSSTALVTTKFYKIKVVGDTDWVALGAASDTAGVAFKPNATSFTGSGKLTIGSGGGSGGSTGFKDLAHSHTGSGGGHSLTKGQLPHLSGRLSIDGWIHGTGDFTNVGGTGNYIDNTSETTANKYTDLDVGNNESHSHSVTVDSKTISPKYIDVIVCTKS
ncbi:MAG: hypothetical protein ABGY21_06510, partial [Pseudomonadota bacterium]